jgi:aspartate-semialdehyde dehydrogenase
VAVVGATGLVGETMIRVLEERNFPVSELYPLASSRSLGKSVMFNRKEYPVDDLATFDFSKADIGLFSAGSEVSREFAPKAAAAGCVVIDNTSEFRYQDDIPLVVPEVNAHALAQSRRGASSRTRTVQPSRCWCR